MVIIGYNLQDINVFVYRTVESDFVSLFQHIHMHHYVLCDAYITEILGMRGRRGRFYFQPDQKGGVYFRGATIIVANTVSTSMPKVH